MKRQPKNLVTKTNKIEPIQKKIMQLLDKAEVEGAFVFYVDKNGFAKEFDGGMCEHELADLADYVVELAKKRSEENVSE